MARPKKQVRNRLRAPDPFRSTNYVITPDPNGTREQRRAWAKLYGKEVNHDMDLVDPTKEDHVPHRQDTTILGAAEGS